MAGALDGLRIIDLTRVLGGPYCTQILADLGADVVKVEPPQGDEVRDWGPPFSAAGLSAYFAGINRNKCSLGLDLAAPAGQAVLLRLLAGADVLVENFRAGTLEKWGLGYDSVLAPRFPRLIQATLTGFGESGPLAGLPGYDAAVQATAGLISINGVPEAEPVRIGIPLVDLGTGLYLAIGILAALAERTRSGRGQRVAAALFDAALALQHPHAANYLMSGCPPARTGNAHPNIAPYDLFPTCGRPVFLAIGNDRQFRTACAILGQPELAEDARFRRNADRVVNRVALTAALHALLLEHDGATLAETLLAAGVPAGAALTLPEALEHPQAVARGRVVEIEDYRGIASPLALSRTPPEVRRPPPAFGVDGRAILREAGFGDGEIEALVASGTVAVERRR
ncbi:MAG: CoA transferase [Alphaproteobacteria bacterium]|nr:CoA transferase [Alphaproteobacteria bacterium]